MIGLIGPPDSVQLALVIAAEESQHDQVVARSYETAEEAPDLAQELDRICTVLLFTGRFPYARASRRGGLRSTLLYVEQSGADLYGAIVRLLRDNDCQLPRISIDTIEPELLSEAFENVGLKAPRHVLALGVEDEPASRTTADLVAFHQGHHAAGDVDLCLTCVGSVFEGLRSLGVPAMRITHARSVMREALRQAFLTARLAATEATQPAAVLIEIPSSGPSLGDESGPYEAQRRRLRAREDVLDIAERLQGRLADVDDQTSIVYTSRGTIESALSRLMEGHDGPLSTDRLPTRVQLGVGLGRTVAAAEENARRALTMGARDGALHVGFPDGDVLRVARDRRATTYRLRETQPAAIRIAEQLGIGPLALARLTSALQQVDASAVTASELARAYGIETRSARRLITSLQRAGMASRLGRQGGPGAGRPQTVYRIDLERLVGSSQP